MSVYLYVDAQYLRKVVEQRLNPIVGVPVTMDWLAIRNQLGAQRAFYYDSIDELQKQGESDDEFDGRLKRQQGEIDAIASVDGYFVRLGSIRGDPKKRRQKEVDVLLAVDMLTHSHRKNMQRAVMVSGDMDVKPVVEAVVEQGTFVTVAHDAATASLDLARVADSRRLLTLRMLWTFTKESAGSQADSIFPRAHRQYNEITTQPARTGSLLGSPIQLFREPGKAIVDLSMHGNFYPDEFWVGDNEDKLLQVVEQEYGAIAWD